MFLFSSCEKHTTAEWIENAVTDYDGNTYNAVKIGQQIWMTENLRTEHFADGREIPFSSNKSYEEPHLYFNSDYNPQFQHQMFLNYGYYYNGAAVLDSLTKNDNKLIQGVCPEGWHIPSISEWNTLFEYIESHERILGDSSNLFCSLARAKDNSSLFSATMAGFFYLVGSGGTLNPRFYTTRAYFWSASVVDSTNSNIVLLRDDTDTVEIITSDRANHYSVRCVKD